MSCDIGFTFHGIGRPARALSEDEAGYWVDEAVFLKILDHVAASSERVRYVITFDDGNLSDHRIALPALAERGLHARFFVLTGRIGWPESLGESEIGDLAAAGMTIGSHGIDHLPWPEIDDATLEAEVAGSRAMLGSLLGTGIEEAGIPFGRYDARVLRALRAAGYRCAWSSDGGRFSDESFLRPRTSLRADMGAAEINNLLDGYLPVGRRFRRALGMTRRRFSYSKP